MRQRRRQDERGGRGDKMRERADTPPERGVEACRKSEEREGASQNREVGSEREKGLPPVTAPPSDHACRREASTRQGAYKGYLACKNPPTS